MNRYEHQFTAVCPSDGQTIIYHLTIKSEVVIMVEEIAEACRLTEPTFHEALADMLAMEFGGKQKLRATHQGVHITTVRSEVAS